MEFKTLEFFLQRPQSGVHLFDGFFIIGLYSKLQKDSNLFVLRDERLPIFDNSKKGSPFLKNRLSRFAIIPEIWMGNSFVELLNAVLFPSNVKDDPEGPTTAFPGLSIVHLDRSSPFFALLSNGRPHRTSKMQ